MKLHIGHHFYGAGNAGDDLMLAGFLEAEKAVGGQNKLSCCSPFDRVVLADRFPTIDWRDYTEEERKRSIAGCDAWLGLGGTPFQCAVSGWMTEHLEQERHYCEELRKPMFFLGVGGQDPAAYGLPETAKLCQQAECIWTRDAATAEAIVQAVPSAKVKAAADLAHLWLETQKDLAAKPGLLTGVFNFDYGIWEGLTPALKALRRLPAGERQWLVQEARPLPGAEWSLLETLPEEEKQRWTVTKVGLAGAERSSGLGMSAQLAWPCGEWHLGSRFHASLVAAWAGSKILVVGTNDKLANAAKDLGVPLFMKGDNPDLLPILLEASQPVRREVLTRFAQQAKQACQELAAALNSTVCK